MDEARVVINLKEGSLELQGPVDFVRHYLDMYRPAVKGLAGLSQAPATREKATPRKKRTARAVKGGRTSVPGTAAIRSELEAGFFDEPRSTGDIKERLGGAGFTFTDGNIRGSLKRLTGTGALAAEGKGKTLRYRRAPQS